jgi:hypothetical protein
LSQTLPRRKALKWFGAALTLPFTAPFLLESIAKEAIKKDEFASFLETSAAIVGVPVSDIDADVAHGYWKKIKTSKAMKAQILSLHRAIQSKGALESVNQISESSRAAAKQLAQIWYTGVVEMPHVGKLRMFYNESLMFKFFSKDRPAPSNCFGTPVDWTKNPYL